MYSGMQVLLTWIGQNDLDAASGNPTGGLGPIGQAVRADTYDRVFILCDYDMEKGKAYERWLKGQCNAALMVFPVNLRSPANFHDIYESASFALKHVMKIEEPVDLTLHLSPGTTQMAATWIILGRTQYPARLIQSSREAGVEEANIPYDIAAEYIPLLEQAADEKRKEASIERPPNDASFESIVYRSREMDAVIKDALKIARRDLPVLIEGETGTGKELLARAIHAASPRSNKPCIAVNCGAFPGTLIGSELFGHRKGSFTGAVTDRKGVFQEAEGGTLFLDEIGEMPLEQQVNLLRPLENRKIRALGDSKETPVNVRIIAASNKDLSAEIQNGNFREDLYYRLNVAALKLPPIKERRGDLTLLVENLLEQINRESRLESGYTERKISVDARRVIQSHNWPGNVRELANTIRRVTLFADGEIISGEDMRRAIKPVAARSAKTDQILDRPVDEGIDLPEIIKEVEKHYIVKAMKETGQNKTKAAELLGYSNYQNLDNRIKKLGLK